MIKITLECSECNASCTIYHDLDELNYIVERCPFCGSSSQIDQETEWEDEGL